MEIQFRYKVENMFHRSFCALLPSVILFIISHIQRLSNGHKHASCTGSKMPKLRIPDQLDRSMKLLLKVLFGGVVLLTVAFAQEPKHAVVAQEPAAPSAASTKQMTAT